MRRKRTLSAPGLAKQRKHAIQSSRFLAGPTVTARGMLAAIGRLVNQRVVRSPSDSGAGSGCSPIHAQYLPLRHDNPDLGTGPKIGLYLIDPTQLPVCEFG